MDRPLGPMTHSLEDGLSYIVLRATGIADESLRRWDGRRRETKSHRHRTRSRKPAMPNAASLMELDAGISKLTDQIELDR